MHLSLFPKELVLALRGTGISWMVQYSCCNTVHNIILWYEQMAQMTMFATF